jgi:hypothetical protein
MQYPSSYLDIAIDEESMQQNNYSHYIKNRNILIKLQDYTHKLMRNKRSTIQDPNMNCELTIFYLNQILHGTYNIMNTMSHVVAEFAISSYDSGSYDDHAMLPFNIQSYFHSLSLVVYKARLLAVKFNNPLRLRKLAFNVCVNAAVDAGRTFEHDNDSIFPQFNTEFVESVNLKQYMLERYMERRSVFGHKSSPNIIFEYILHQNDTNMSRVINYLN